MSRSIVERDRLLYVLRAQEDEARTLGAKRLPGDCRWTIPPGASAELVRAFSRFQTEAAMERWVVEKIGDLAPELLDRVAVVLTGRRGAGLDGDRIYLHVSNKERVQARRLGADWDPVRQRLFVMAGTPLEPFRRYLTAESIKREAAEIGREVRNRSKIRHAVSRIASESRVVRKTAAALEAM